MYFTMQRITMPMSRATDQTWNLFWYIYLIFTTQSVNQNRTNITKLLFFFLLFIFLTKKWTSAVCGGVRAHSSHPPPSLRAWCRIRHCIRANNYAIFNIRFQGPRVQNSFDKNVKTTSLDRFRENIKIGLSSMIIELIATFLSQGFLHLNICLNCLPSIFYFHVGRYIAFENSPKKIRALIG